MNIFWVISLLLTTAAICLLIVFLVPMGNKNISRLSELIFKIRYPLLFGAGIYSILFVQEYMNMSHAQEKYHRGSPDQRDQFFFDAASMFKSQRDIYLVALGFASFLGLLIVVWQIHSISSRNEVLRSK